MDKTIRKILFSLMLSVMAGFGFAMMGSVVVYAEQNDKIYEYVVSKENNLFTLSGQYENGGTYGLGASSSIEQIMSVIDYDRQVLGEYQDVKIKFDNITLGNSSLEFTKGNVVLTGSLTASTYSSFGLVYVKGANVTFEDLTLINNGYSYLVRNDGSKAIEFVSGTFSSVYTTIVSKGPADVVITGGTFDSQNSAVIDFQPSSPVAKLNISATTSQTRLNSRVQDMPCVNAKNAVLEISGGTIKNLLNGSAINLENVLFTLSNNSKISGGDVDIITNQKIFAGGYTGQEISIMYNEELVSGQTIVVEGLDEPLFGLQNQGFTLAEKNGGLVAFKTHKLTYLDPNGYLRFVPVENEEFLEGEIATVQMPSSASYSKNALNLVNFLGWSEEDGALTATYTETNNELLIGETDITLYAVWENKEYHINYLGIADSINHNPLEYTTNTEISFENPEKRYYKFTGWVVNGAGAPQVDLVLPADTYGDLILTATWELEKYSITYYGLPNDVVLSLGLPTTYTIESQPLTINLNKVMVLGYSYYGVYLDVNRTVVCDEIIYFAPENHDDNSQNFNRFNEIGEGINIYIDAIPYFNGVGQGTLENPFMISNAEQFEALLLGQKLKTAKPVQVKLQDDIVVNKSFAQNAKLTGFVVDGDGKTITIEKMTKTTDAIAFLPVLENAEVKNLKVIAEQQIIYASSKTSFAGFAGKIQDSTIQNLEISLPVTFVCDGISTASTIKFGGLALNAANSVFDGVTNLGDFKVSVLSVGGDVNIYGAGLVGFSANDCLFVNCKQRGDIEVLIQQLPYETHTYIAGLACLEANNKVVNSLSSGNIKLYQTKESPAVLCGLVVPFGAGNSAKNVAVTNAVVAESSLGVLKEEISLGTCQKTDAFKPNDFSYANAEGTLKKLVKNIDKLQQELGLEISTWFFDNVGNLDFTNGLYVTYNGNGMLPNKTVYYANVEQAKNAYISFNTSKFLFYGWKSENGEYVDWGEVAGPSITLTADYALFDDLIFAEKINVVIFEGFVLLLVLFVMWLFDRKKPVYFIKSGRPVGMVKVARTKAVPLPKDFEGKICFMDERGCRPFLKNKMPCHKLTLYVFDEFKQNRLEGRLRAKEQNQKQLALNQILLYGIMRERQKEIKKAKHAKVNKSLKPQAQKPEGENKNVVVNKNNENKITIIKKEIKVLKSEENFAEKNKNASKKIKKSKK